MRLRVLVTLLAAALVAVACVDGQPRSGEPSQRIAAMRRALVIHRADPCAAAELLAQAGPGPILESARFEIWLDSLDRGRCPASAWQHLLDAPPPPDMRVRAAAGLGRALFEEDRPLQAQELLEQAADPLTDTILLELAGHEASSAAALRLARRAPVRLLRHAPEKEAAALAALDPEGWLERAAAWRRSAATSRAIAELEARRWRGEADRRRRLELARAYVDRGSPRRALSLLASSATGEEELVRALAYRIQGWQRFPRSASDASFRSCLQRARRAALRLDDDPGLRQEALRLVVECGTETGAVAEALQAWWRLAGEGWDHPNREWLGRRLGVAAAQQEGWREEVVRLAGALPQHARCLRYWHAVGTRRNEELWRLAEVPVADLYGRWARQTLAVKPPDNVELLPPTGMAQPPRSVQILIDSGAEEYAAREWRRLRRARGASAAEALGAARFEAAQGRTDHAIRGLLEVFPELVTVRITELPEDLVKEYLPLRFTPQLVAAAQEFGLPPWLVAGLARQESLFLEGARSPRGAIGVLQLIPSTAQIHSRALGLGPLPNLYDPAVNLRLGAREIAQLLQRYRALEPALAAYNAGDGRVRRWWRQWPDAGGSARRSQSRRPTPMSGGSPFSPRLTGSCTVICGRRLHEGC